ncbi:MAG TPA: DUF4215 domain-containing protein, partial [Polyangiaceae bacterium]|nr:DUF4215 domain-containing protein [Polyangiaceae bacterium]
MFVQFRRISAVGISWGWVGLCGAALAVGLAAGCSSDAAISDNGNGNDSGDSTDVGSGDAGLDDVGFGDDDSGLGGSTPTDPCLADNPPDYCILQYETAGPGCGDGEVNQADEQCDDGNGFPGDGCNGLCQVEANWDCSSGECVQTITCGDGVREGYEVCDDGDTQAGNGCSADCLSIDPFFLCPVDGGACVSTVACGDGRISGNEQCEDGDTDPNDGCGTDCRLEAGWFCPGINKPCQKVPFCGDGIQGGGEECDDKDTDSGDGCSEICQVENGYACPEPGKACIAIVIDCGDGVIAGTETCDDGNKASSDGCSSSCQVETGFSCPTAGALCNPICGDGKRVGNEACDDGRKDNGDGCSAKCTWEPGFFCQPAAPHGCVADTCGNTKVGNGESCDDGNKVPGDGCSPDCRAEPSCTTYGTAGCTSKCGDGLLIGEECDDGNTRNGDGCSSTCKVEVGFSCVQPSACATKLPWDHDNDNATAAIPTCVDRVPVIYRDVDANHPHFEPGWNSGGTQGMVLTTLDAAGKPVWSGTSDGVINSGNSSYFSNWYRDSSSSTTVLGELVLWDRDRVATDAAYATSQNASGISFVNRWGAEGEQWRILSGGSGPKYSWCSNNAADGCAACAQANMVACHAPCTPWNNTSACAEYPPDTAGTWTAWDGNPLFFPVDGKGRSPTGEYGMADVPDIYGGGSEASRVPGATSHNFHFTSEIRRWFKYDSSKTYKLDFTGDDDVWVFINGKLAVDLGGWHPALDGTVTINAASAATFSLQNGKVYEIVVFQAERKKTGSSYRLTLSGFNSNASVCSSV